MASIDFTERPYQIVSMPLISPRSNKMIILTTTATAVTTTTATTIVAK